MNEWRGWRQTRQDETRRDETRRDGKRTVTDGIGTPTQPEKLNELVSLIKLGDPYMFLNWLSGVLVGVGGSEFVG